MYQVVRKAIPHSLLMVCDAYYQIQFFVKQDFDTDAGKLLFEDTVQPFSRWRYADPLTESLMLYVRDIVREETGKNLEPSYSCTRYYENGQWLKSHTDRPACQYGVTVPVHRRDDTPWPIYMEGEAIELDVGDLLLYTGIEHEHWREPYQGELQVQCHLHYVDMDDPDFAKHYLDRRENLGMKHVDLQ